MLRSKGVPYDEVKQSSTTFIAGARYELNSSPIARAKLCPDDLNGVCRKKSGCNRGLHGLYIIAEEEERIHRASMRLSGTPNVLTPRFRRVGLNAEESYHSDPAGMGSSQGPRHDNDFADVSAIQILPTTDEILSLRLPHLSLKTDAAAGDDIPVTDHFRQHCAAQFRHLRYEIIEPIVDSLYLSLQLLVTGRYRPTPRDYIYHRQTHKGVGFNYFHGVEFETTHFHEHDSIHFRISFNCPVKLRDQGMQSSTVFESGMLCAIVAVDTMTNMLYTVFMETVSRHSTQSMIDKAPDHSRAAVMARLAEGSSVAQARELMWIARLAPSTVKIAIVDLQGILLAGQIHHLNRLKGLSVDENRRAPFGDIITAKAGLGSRVQLLSWPNYLLETPVSWNIDGIKREESLSNSSGLDFSNREIALDQLHANTSLDKGQALALYENLTQQLAFTQGPPGTGKSYLGIATVKVLVDSVPSRSRGPILVVAQTNHALDEMLEGLLAKDIDAIARLGSRSKSTKLSSKLLKNLRRTQPESCLEITRRRDAARWARRLEMDGLTFCDTIARIDQQPARYLSLDAVPTWQGSPEEAKSSSSGRADVSEGSGEMTASDLRRIEERDRRLQLAAFLGEIHTTEQVELLVELYRRHQLARVAVADARRMKHVDSLKSRDVIGMTTTACAREFKLIEQLKPRILVIEEASEVLEAHTMCALVPSIEHCINIGDPLQLRPQVNNRILDTEYSPHYRLNESLFERLIKAGLPYAKLCVQRRAHPILSKLIRATNYPYVVDHEATYQRASVTGMCSRMQWCHHENEEKLVTPQEGLLTESWANEYEADMAVHFATKFVKSHGYGPGEVAIITPYNGQLALIVAKLAAKKVKINVSRKDKDALLSGGYLSRDDLAVAVESDELQVGLSEFLRITTLDNFQGEEARIVIFCTVRSNKRNKIGFLKNSNRINVAVSRAKEGFYVVGNASILRDNSPHWATIIKEFEAQGSLMAGFQVACRYHPDEKILVGSVAAAERAADWLSFGCQICESW